MSSDEALNHLLSDTNLTWKLVDSRVIAVYEARCEEQPLSSAQCPNSEQTLSKYPIYVPGLEETWIYGSQTTGSHSPPYWWSTLGG